MFIKVIDTQKQSHVINIQHIVDIHNSKDFDGNPQYCIALSTDNTVLVNHDVFIDVITDLRGYGEPR